MPRRTRRVPRPAGGTGRPAATETEDGQLVRQVIGSKAYRCPGCDQLVPPGAVHVVAWPVGREDDRRHWHRPCWQARHHRGPRLLRSRDAPRYG